MSKFLRVTFLSPFQSPPRFHFHETSFLQSLYRCIWAYLMTCDEMGLTKTGEREVAWSRSAERQSERQTRNVETV